MWKILMTFGLALAITTAYATPMTKCRSDTLSRAEKLLALHSENDDRREIDKTRFKRLSPIKDPEGRGKLEVEEVWGFVYKGEFRMRFTYRMVKDRCVLIGEEIVEY